MMIMQNTGSGEAWRAGLAVQSRCAEKLVFGAVGASRQRLGLTTSSLLLALDLIFDEVALLCCPLLEQQQAFCGLTRVPHCGREAEAVLFLESSTRLFCCP
jgi:hypothetical protein